MLESLKSLCHTPVQILNQPVIKNGVKQSVGICTFAFGVFELYDLCRVYQFRKKREMVLIPEGTGWGVASQNTQDFITLTGRISRLFSAAVSPPGVYLITKGMHCVFTTPQLERVFGVNTIFAVNWRHPRHVVSLAAVILALPTIAQSAYHCFAERRVLETPTQRIQTAMLFFNTFTSRPVLHLGNLALH